MSERPNRDISRGHFERSVGTTLVNQLMEPYYADAMQRLEHFSPSRLQAVGTARAEEINLLHPAWGMAQAVAETLLKPDAFATPDNEYSETVDGLLHKGMLAPSVSFMLYEAAETQSHFPLRFAHDIAKSAREQGASTFNAADLHDIATILRRPDFRLLVDKSAATANGVWGPYSTTHTMKLQPWKNGMPPLSFLFDAEGNASFTPEMEKYLTDALRKVNSNGIPYVSSQAQHESASSGCPARRLKPTFRNTEEDQERLDLLARYFSKAPEEITAPVRENMINQGLDLTADALDYAHARLQPTSSLAVIALRKTAAFLRRTRQR